MIGTAQNYLPNHISTREQYRNIPWLLNATFIAWFPEGSHSPNGDYMLLTTRPQHEDTTVWTPWTSQTEGEDPKIRHDHAYPPTPERECYREDATSYAHTPSLLSLLQGSGPGWIRTNRHSNTTMHTATLFIFPVKQTPAHPRPYVYIQRRHLQAFLRRRRRGSPDQPLVGTAHNYLPNQSTRPGHRCIYNDTYVATYLGASQRPADARRYSLNITPYEEGDD